MNGRCVFTDSYESIYERMKAKYEELSGADFDEGSDIAIRLRVLAGEIFNAQSGMEWLKRQMFAATACGEYLDHIAQERGLTRRPPAKASGTLYFTVTEAPSEPIFIPAGTVVATNEASPVRIYTTEDSEIPRMALSAEVPAEAENTGFRGNIAGGLATVPVNMPPEINAVTNVFPFHGGFDGETDETLRKRIRDTYTCMPNGMNKAFYIQLAESVEGVEKAGAVPYARGMGTCNVYVCGSNGAVSQETLGAVNDLLQSKRSIVADIQVLNANSLMYDLNVTVKQTAGYSSREVTDLCTSAFEEYLSSLPVGGRVYLSALGKYLLETGCIENYEFDMSMNNVTAPGSQYFVSGDVTIEVTQ